MGKITEIVPAGPGGPSLGPVLEDYRRRHALSEAVVLNALIEALATGRAQALVALQAGRPVGAVVLSRQGGRGRIHLLYALPEAAEAEAALLGRAEEELSRGGGLEHISATLALLPGGTLEETFREYDYRVLSRARMVVDLADWVGETRLPPGYRLAPWQAQRLEEAATLVEMAHRGSEDLLLYPELAGLEGARLLLARALRGEFGDFDPALSPMALAGEELAGLCLAVWHVAIPGQGFITDVCVRPAHQRRGLGRALVVATAQAFQEAGAETLGLAVTLSNRPALQLYERLGLHVTQHFSVFQRLVRGSTESARW